MPSLNKLINSFSSSSSHTLTINCAWNAEDIDAILDTLSKNDVKATFFIVGDWAEKFPDAVKKISNRGNYRISSVPLLIHQSA